ncbi:hypothetical protein AVEN_227437-1 [Araneus ventricosus]|uniref:Uncharacterized protein n=1 Tax=Araneus ventricosus TaxID=182803 RepID=A0A4Y2VWZ9_ARAVE|nr:hypothetical protein AVEN_266551-1 [Araneus ventricosus]GBO28826.1 hypothetical protein AVEN_227437-1 [Araneus ventricosus]
MQIRFPSILDLCLGREFYRAMYGNIGRMEALTHHLGDKHGDHFGDEMWHLKSTGIFLISSMGPRSGFIQMIPCDITAFRGDYKKTLFGSQCVC